MDPVSDVSKRFLVAINYYIVRRLWKITACSVVTIIWTLIKHRRTTRLNNVILYFSRVFMAIDSLWLISNQAFLLCLVRFKVMFLTLQNFSIFCLIFNFVVGFIPILFDINFGLI